MTCTFNSEKYAEELEAAGVPRNQASIHARTLGAALKDMICKADFDRGIECLRREMKQLEERLNLRLDMLRTEINAKITELHVRFDGVHGELVVHRWALGGVFAICTANLALMVKIAFP